MRIVVSAGLLQGVSSPEAIIYRSGSKLFQGFLLAALATGLNALPMAAAFCYSECLSQDAPKTVTDVSSSCHGAGGEHRQTPGRHNSCPRGCAPVSILASAKVTVAPAVTGICLAAVPPMHVVRFDSSDARIPLSFASPPPFSLRSHSPLRI